MKSISTYIIIGAIAIFTGCDKNKAEKQTGAKENKGFFEKLFASNKEVPSKLKPVEYINWCEDQENELKQSKQIGDFTFSAFYQPHDYLAIKELNKGESVNSKEFEEKIKEYGEMTYCSFRLENSKTNGELLKTDLSSDQQYYGRLEYMSFKMQEDFKLIQGNDTLPCSMYHFERIYSLAPYATFVLGFPKTDSKEDIKLWFHDKLFNNGIVILNFKTESIHNLPKLEI
mgnify:CR=1 FL=1